MGSELVNMDIEDLDNILHEVSRGNTRDMSTFRETLLEMYGGMDIRQYQKLEAFIRSELGIHSDAELYGMDSQKKMKVIEYLH